MNPKHIRTVAQSGSQRTVTDIQNENGIRQVTIEGLKRQIEFTRDVLTDSYLIIEVDNEPPEVDTRPGEDAGEALVGVMCWVWVRYRHTADLEIVSLYDETGRNGTSYYCLRSDCWYDHARPNYLGHPDPAIRAREEGRC